MPSRYGRTPLLVWDEDDYTELSPAAQHLDYVMRHDPTLSACGRVDWRPARIATRARGWTVAMIEEAADELEERGFAAFDAATEEAVARRHIRWDEPLRNPKMAIALHRAYGAVASKKLRAAVVTEVRLAREIHPDFSSWTSPLSAELMTRMLGLPSLEDLGITNPITNHIGNPDRSGSPPALVTESVPEEVDPITNPDDVITNGIGNANRYGTPTPNYQLPTTIGGSLNGGTSPSVGAQRETPPPPPRFHSGHESGYARECDDCAATFEVREAWLLGLLAAAEPRRTCERHPRGTDAPCRECGDARQAHDRWQLDRERATEERRRTAAAIQSDANRQAAEDRARAIAVCGLCDADGYRDGRVCDHDPDSVDRHRRGIAAARIVACRYCDADGHRADGTVCDHKPSRPPQRASAIPEPTDTPDRPYADQPAPDPLPDSEEHARA